MKFTPIDPKKSVPQNEEEILKFWKNERIFEKSVETRNPQYPFVFFDGPPFATGTPHYGHILTGTIKDAIPRYWTMKGYRVERRFGWDCHGVPVEFQVEKENKIGGKPEIEKMGVDKYNELCRSIVLRCRDEWEATVDRMGRFVDFQNDYKTMDADFMESVWWVFKSLWDKGLIYEGEKVVPYSPMLGSPLSNFEAGLNYKDIDDPAVTVKFELVDAPGTFILAWTTTPWTLPSNISVGFGRDTEYVLVEEGGEKYWIAEEQAGNYFSHVKEAEDPSSCFLFRKKGKDFAGVVYRPLFDFFKNWESKKFICVHDDGDYISTTEGTGIVHFAPAFGAEDAELCAKWDILGPNPINEEGYFEFKNWDTVGGQDLEPLQKELEGKYFRSDPEILDSKENNANDWVIQKLKEKNFLFKREQIRHSYPHCWRTDCALMYRGIKTWFVDIQKIKKQMLEQNQNINWNPEHLKNGRFGKGLETAPDWAISRNRYWGAPMPVWRCDHCGEIHVIGSRGDLESKTGQEVKDLHKHFVDHLIWDCEKCDGGTMKRILEVLDCWFESGAMPYASQHYPFANQNQESGFGEADFIAEGLDQTRGWFYTLHVLGTALFGKNIFRNVVTNGIVLAEDGQKMSKSKKNYPDPNLIFDKYGADAMRFYLLSSPVVRGENLRFVERGVEEVLKSVLLPLQNAYNFFSTYANIDHWQPTKFVFVRHGQADHNTLSIYSCNDKNKHSLTLEGVNQIKKTAQELPSFDVLIASPFVRTRETAALIKKETGFLGDIIIDDLVREVEVGELEGGSLVNRKDRFAAKGAEQVDEILARCKNFLEIRGKEFAGKTVVVATHGDIVKACHILETGAPHVYEAFDMFPKVQTGSSVTAFPFPDPQNDLDKWILSELQTTIEDFQASFDKYELETALRTIPKFVDNLNNWYLRRSRRRFWEGKPGQFSADKQSAYETLHHVLLVLSKILAPVCPFFAEKLFQDLGGRESVHLCMFPYVTEAWIDKEAEAKVALSREIVRLAASIRGRAKIKLRQPLQKLRFALSSIQTRLIASLPLDTIKEEANVKEVELIQSLDGIAQKIVRVDARQVGKKFGKKVQDLIRAGKEGQFKELEDGRIEIEGETLEEGEYEFGFLCEEGVEAEATVRSVALLDTVITEELEIEGYAREVIRAIQEMRKNNGFEVSDRIMINYQTDSKKLQKAFSVHEKMITEETLAVEMRVFGEGGEKLVIEEELLEIGLKKF